MALLQKWISIVTAIWTVLFVCWLPFQLAHRQEIARWATAPARVSEHRVVVVKGKSGSQQTVRATLTFQRMQDGHPVDCRIENYAAGPANEPDSFATAIEVATPPQSCDGAVKVPLPGDWRDDVLVFAVLLLFILLFTAVFVWRHIAEDRPEAMSTTSP